MIWTPKFTEREYARMLIKCFPPGAVFPRDENKDLFALMEGLGAELRRIDEQVHGLIKEAHPEQADQLIAEWEIDTGFPDDCYNIALTLVERRAQVLRRIIFPGFLTTGWTGTGDITAGSDIITNCTSTDGLYIGDAVQPSAGYPGGKYIVKDKTANTITLEQIAHRTAAGVSLTAYFEKAEASERFFKQLLEFLGYTFYAFEYFDIFQVGPAPNGYAATGDPQSGSDTIINVSSTAGIEVGHYLWIKEGFNLIGGDNKELKVLAKTANTIQVDRNATATAAGTDLIGFNLQPAGCGDGIGDAFAHAVTIKFILGASPADTDALLKCVFNKLKQSHTVFLYQVS